MKVVVTGATSFIGAATVQRLLMQGHEVCAVVRPGSANLAHLLAQAPESGAFGWLELDLQEIARFPYQTGAWTQADAWVHIGWDGAGSDNRTRRDVQQDNVRHSLDAVRTAAALGCTRFLFTGSQAEYGRCREAITEDAPCHPVSEYGKAKVDFYRQAERLCKELDLEYLHTRIFSVYGPGDHPWSLIQSCIGAWKQDGVIELGECTQKWNFLYIEDAASALVCLLTKGRAGVYNIASEDTRILREYIEELYRLCGSRGSYRYGVRAENAEGPADLMPDITKICQETGWRPETTFAEGIYETLHCMQGKASKEVPV